MGAKQSLVSDGPSLLGNRTLPSIQLSDQEKKDWTFLFQDLLRYLVNLQVKLPIITIGVPEDTARSMTQAVGTFNLSQCAR